MFQRLLLIIFCLGVAAGASRAAVAGDKVPAWLQQAATQKTPNYPLKDMPAVLLYHEKILTVAEDGRVITTTNYAVRILRREGRRTAVARETYLTTTGKVKELRAWLARANGTTKKYGKDETADIAYVNDVYNEYRTRIIIAADDVSDGDVFGYQAVSEDRSVFAYDNWEFQLDFEDAALPTVLSRYTLNLPTGWAARSTTFNASEIKPTVSGSSYTWEMRDLPPHPDEPLSPPMTNIVPRLAVGYAPAEAAKTILKTFHNWQEVAVWKNELSAPQATVNDALAAKVQELTANAKNEFEKIQAIARYVQNLQYISVQTNIGYGGGYRPHSAVEVFAKAYGDCKDKANLMLAMLSVVKIKAHLVSIFSGDPTYVRAEWASPDQFNHCIIAIEVSDATQVPTVVKHPTLGRLLIFDATDESTPLGDLPWHEQGSLALIVHRSTTELLTMPVLPSSVNRLDRQAAITMEADGSIQGKIKELSVGQEASFERGALRGLSRTDYNKVIEGWLSNGMGSVKAAQITPQDFHNEGRFTLDVDFSAAAYGQLMQGRLLVFKPALVSRQNYLALPNTARARPVQLEARAFTETVQVALPKGFIVDETPDPVTLETPFGSYLANYEVKDGKLLFTRKLEQKRVTVPVAQYNQVRDFFARIRAVEQNSVVLARQ